MVDQSGQTIKGYELRERIGAGGMGAVYRAYQSTIGREVAIKIILPHFANHPDFIRRFETEAQLVARLEHPYIIPLYDYWRDTKGAYLVMRWLRGGSLRDALEEGPFDPIAAARLLDQICGALSVAHRNNVIHRDLKPANILLDEDGNAYLADFGIAKDLALPNAATQDGAVVVSPDYAAPEQVRSEPITAQTDIYAMGILIYEMLTAHHPFPDASTVERMFKHLNDSLPLILDLDDTIADRVNGVIAQATAKNPAQRYPDTLSMAVAFRQAANLHSDGSTRLVEALTQREQAVLQLLIDGRSNREIAQTLTVSLPTVKWYVRQIYAKLRVRSRVQAIVRARELDLIPASSGIQDVLNAADPALHTIEVADLPNPYKGLRAFESADYDDFFGREDLIAKLIQRMGERKPYARFLAVVGPSGSGKSSAIKAGLIPALWRGHLPGSEKWFIVEMLPGRYPLDELEVALTRVAANQADNMREHLARDARGLVRVAQLILPQDGSELVLVIDQFEEVFTLVHDEALRIHFLESLYTAVADPRSRVRVIITLRADFYDRPLHYANFGELLRSRMETILPLNAEGLEQAIKRPAEAHGVSYESGLVASIVAEVHYQPGALPQLQYALTELFERRDGLLLTRRTYEDIGGTLGALARRAEDLFTNLDTTGRELTRQMFVRLVTLGEGVEDTRRRTLRSELMGIAPDPDLMEEIIDAYAAHRLLSLDHDSGTRSPTVELAHEAMLREWERLRLWLDASRDDIRQQRILIGLTREWIEASQDDSFLLHGTRLEQFEQWSTRTKLTLTKRERSYLEASHAARAQAELVEQARQAHEQRLERRSQTFLRALVAVFGFAAVIALAMFLYALGQNRVARAERDRATSLALASASQAALSTGNTDLAVALSVAANRIEYPPPLAQRALYEAAYAPGTHFLLQGHTANLTAAAFRADGKFALTGDAAGTAILWDLTRGNERQHFDDGISPDIFISGVAFLKDDRVAASIIDSSRQESRILIWDAASGSVLARIESLEDRPLPMTFMLDAAPAGDTFVSVHDDGSIILWAAGTGEVLRRFEGTPDLPGHSDFPNTVRFSPNGQRVLTQSSDALILWDVQTGRPAHRFEGHTGFPGWIVTFSADGRRALSTGNELILWDVETGEEIRSFDNFRPDYPFASVALSPDGRTAAVAYLDSGLLLVDLESGEVLQRLFGHGRAVNIVLFSPDGRHLLSISNDDTARFWDIENGAIVHRLDLGEVTEESSQDTSFSPDGRSLVLGANGGAALWNMDRATTDPGSLRLLEDSAGYGNFLVYSLDGTLVAGAGFDTAVVWDVASGRRVGEFSIADQEIISLTFSPDSQRLAAGTLAGDSTQAVVWGIRGDQTMLTLTGLASFHGLAFSPDGRLIATGGSPRDLVLWDAATGERLRNLVGHTDFVFGLDFSPDGQTLLSTSWDGTLRLWDMTTGKELRQYTGHESGVNDVIFGPTGTTALSTANNGSVILWDVRTGEILRRFDGHQSWYGSLSPNGSFVALRKPGDVVEVWDLALDLDALLSWTYTNRYVGELTCTEREIYDIKPLCDKAGSFPTRTPYPMPGF